MMKKLACLLLTLLVLNMSAVAINPACAEPLVAKEYRLTVTLPEKDSPVFQVSFKGNAHLKYKLLIQKGDEEMVYDLDPHNTSFSIPFTFGSGSYTVTLCEQIPAKRKHYYDIGHVVVSSSVHMRDVWLSSNYLVDMEDSKSLDSEISKALDGLDLEDADAEDVFLRITSYLTGHYCYDFIKAYTGNAAKIQTLDETIRSKRCICSEISILATAMFRSCGIPAKTVTGYADNQPHAWVVAKVGDKVVRYDFTADQLGVLGIKYIAKRWF